MNFTERAISAVRALTDDAVADHLAKADEITTLFACEGSTLVVFMRDGHRHETTIRGDEHSGYSYMIRRQPDVENG